MAYRRYARLEPTSRLGSLNARLHVGPGLTPAILRACIPAIAREGAVQIEVRVVATGPIDVGAGPAAHTSHKRTAGTDPVRWEPPFRVMVFTRK